MARNVNLTLAVLLVCFGIFSSAGSLPPVLAQEPLAEVAAPAESPDQPAVTPVDEMAEEPVVDPVEPNDEPADESDTPAEGEADQPAEGAEKEAAAEEGEAVETNWHDLGWVKLVATLAVMVLPFVLGSFLSKRLHMADYSGKISLVLFCLFFGVVVTVLGWPPTFGIDLRGGVILVYEIDESVEVPDVDQKQAPDEEGNGEEGDDKEKEAPRQKVDMGKLATAIGRRVNPGGVKEVTVRQRGAREIEIIVPEVDPTEVDRLKRIISSVGTLEFRILANNRDHESQIQRANAQEGAELRDADGNLLAWWVPVAEGKETSFPSPDIARRDRVRHGETVGQEILVVKDLFDVNGGYLTRASTGLDESNRPCVFFNFDSRGGQRFGRLTANNLPTTDVQEFSRQLGIILDGYLHSAPAIRSKIGSNGQITGDFTRQEVDELVDVLNAGSLPTALSEDPISELVTGPTMGKDMIRKGSIAIGLSMVMVLVFMLVYYRFSGIVACMALLMNLVLVLAIMIVVQAAFTLPGIAGLVLTVGIAVDANVLIFERIREELDRNATLRMAIRNGFSRATSAIVDANITTLITATVLYVIGTDQIRGFAVTLWLGVVLSMFTAIFCARVVFDIAEKQKWITKLSMMRIVGGTNIDFLGKRHAAAVFSIALIVIGMVAVVGRGKGILDIDFTGGASVEILFTEAQDIADIRGTLKDLPDLTVSSVQVQGEEPDRRFIINTSSPPDKDGDAYLQEVRQRVTDSFGLKLVHYSMTFETLPISDGGPLPGSSPADPPPEPDPNEQTRNDLPPDTLLASADPAAILLAQADAPPEPEPKEDAPADPKKADGPTLTPAGDPEPSAPAEPVAMPEETPAVPAPPADPPVAPPDVPEKPETPSTRFVGGSWGSLNFEHAVSHDTLDEMFRNEFNSNRFKPVDFELSNEKYLPGDDDIYNTWDVQIMLPADEAEALFTVVKTHLEGSPVFPSSSSIGGKVAGSLQVKGIAALMASLVVIVGYIWIRFQRVMFGLAAVVALVHDVLITLGMLAMSAYVAKYLDFMGIYEFKIGLPVLAAFLTIIGYSLNDTIVVFDRIREVRGKSPQLTEHMINTSINQTLARTLLTSLTTLLVVVILYIGGGQGIHTFAFSLVVGVIVGTYSSIFVASPVLLWMSRPANGSQTNAR